MPGMVQWIVLIDAPLFVVACAAVLFSTAAAAADRERAAKKAVVYRAFAISRLID